MTWPWRKKTTPASDQEARSISVVAECEAFLAGRYGELVARRPGPLPAWVRLNWLAHAEPDGLRELVERGSGAREGWPKVMAGLAAELLAYGRHQAGPIRSLQRDVLVPLELRILAEDPSVVLRPDQFAHLVDDTLRQHIAGCS